MDFLKGLRNGLEKSREEFLGRLNRIVSRFRSIDEDMLQNLEEILIEADVGFKATQQMIERIKERAKKEGITSSSAIKGLLYQEILRIFRAQE